MIDMHCHEPLARPVRSRGLAPSWAGLGASAHRPTRPCARNALAPPRLQPCGLDMGLHCGAARADIADTGD